MLKRALKCFRGEGGLCDAWATHVLIYINATTFKEITDKPKWYCFHHAHMMQVETKRKHGILSRIYTTEEWLKRVEAYQEEKRRVERR